MFDFKVIDKFKVILFILLFVVVSGLSMRDMFSTKTRESSGKVTTTRHTSTSKKTKLLYQIAKEAKEEVKDEPVDEQSKYVFHKLYERSVEIDDFISYTEIQNIVKEVLNED